MLGKTRLEYWGRVSGRGGGKGEHVVAMGLEREWVHGLNAKHELRVSSHLFVDLVFDLIFVLFVELVRRDLD